MNAPAVTTLGAAFTAVARAHPHRTALVQGDLRIGYGELAARAAAAAGRLAGGLTPDEPVGICARRSPGTIATVLAVVLAGGAYLPIDPEAPDDRIRALVEDSRVRTVFAAAHDLTRLRDVLPPGVAVLPIEEDAPQPGEAPPSALPEAAPRRGPDSPRLRDPHLGQHRHAQGGPGRGPFGPRAGARPEAGLGPDDVVLQLAPLHVDPSVFEIWGPCSTAPGSCCRKPTGRACTTSAGSAPGTG